MTAESVTGAIRPVAVCVNQTVWDTSVATEATGCSNDSQSNTAHHCGV